MWLAIAGLFLTTGFGVWGVYVTLRRHYPGRLTFVPQHVIGLFDTIVKDIPDIAVVYHGEAVRENLVLLRGAILNSGSRDMGPDSTERALSLTLPAHFAWREAAVVSTSEGVVAKFERASDQVLQLVTGLFRCDEWIRVQAIAEVPVDHEDLGERELGKKLWRALSFSHRIADTAAVEVRWLYPIPQRLFRTLLVEAVALCLLGIALMLMTSVLPHARLAYAIKTPGGDTRRVAASFRVGGQVSVRELNGQFKSEMPLEQFLSSVAAPPVVVRDTDFDTISRIVGAAAMVLGIAILIADAAYRRRTTKLRRILKLDTTGGEAASALTTVGP